MALFNAMNFLCGQIVTHFVISDVPQWIDLMAAHRTEMVLAVCLWMFSVHNATDSSSSHSPAADFQEGSFTLKPPLRLIASSDRVHSQVTKQHFLNPLQFKIKMNRNNNSNDVDQVDVLNLMNTCPQNKSVSASEEMNKSTLKRRADWVQMEEIHCQSRLMIELGIRFEAEVRTAVNMMCINPPNDMHEKELELLKRTQELIDPNKSEEEKKTMLTGLAQELKHLRRVRRNPFIHYTEFQWYNVEGTMWIYKNLVKTIWSLMRKSTLMNINPLPARLGTVRYELRAISKNCDSFHHYLICIQAKERCRKMAVCRTETHAKLT